MLCNLSVLLVHLDVLMLILSIAVSLVHDHISYAVNLLSCLNICFIIIIINLKLDINTTTAKKQQNGATQSHIP